MARTVDEALLGRTIAGKFVIESFLGGGAMGAVYKAKQLSLDKAVAIKVLHADLSDATFVARFQREAKAASKLDHPNSMRVLDYGKDTDGLCYIAMEFLDGKSLFRILKDEDGPLPEMRTVDLTRQILAALAAAHDMGIIHRDLKPENIIVVETKGDDGNVSETVKVCDFGMAKMMVSEVGVDTSVEKLTSRGVVIGTPEYMSPEQGKGEELDVRSDLYSVGIILYQMLAGRLPFQADTPIATLVKHMVEAPTAPSLVAPDVHPGLEAVCLRAISKAREDRFASAREMRAALRAAVEADDGRPSEETPLSLPQSSVRVSAPRSPFHSVPDDVPATDEPAVAPPVQRLRALDALDANAPKPRPPYVAMVLLLAGVLGAGGFFLLRGPAAAAPAVSAPIAVSTPPAASAPAPHPEPPVPVAEPSTTAPSAQAAPAAPAAEGKSLGAAVASKAVRATNTGAQAEAIPPRASGVSGNAPAAPAAPAEPPSSPSPAPASAPSAAVPAEASPFEKASVSFGSVRGGHVQPTDVTAVLPSGKMNQCYREWLRGHGSAVGGAGMLHLVFADDGHVSEASFAGPPNLAAVGQCIAGAVTGRNIKNVESGATGADVDLSFKPD